MKNTRKLFAGLTALCCIGTLLTAFPVSAESDFNPNDAGNFFIVSGTKGSATMLNFHYYGADNVYSDLVQTYPTEAFSYGDVLVYDGEFSILETYPAQLGGNASNLRKIGTYEDFFDTKNLTVTSAEFPGSDIKFGEFQLIDNAGNTYSYYQDYTNVDYGISLQTAQVGDSYTFAVLDNTVLLPLEKQEQPVFNAEEFFVVTKTYPESGYYMLEYFHDNALHRTCRFQTDMKLSYGDILLADNGFTTERMENYQAVYELSLNEDTTLQNIGNCTDLMEHKKMTVKSMGYDGRPIQPSFRFFTYTLADEDGKEYYYSAEDSFGSDVSVVFSTGDVVEFAVYSGGAVIPLETPPDCVELFVYDYAVIGTDNAENPKSCILADEKGGTWQTGTEYLPEGLAVGDVISIQNAELISTSTKATNSLSIEPLENYSAQKTGSILENPETAEFTVTYIPDSDHLSTGIRLEKFDGWDERVLFIDWIEYGYAEYDFLDWSTVSVFDTVTCLLYNGYPVLGIEKTPENVPVLTGDADGSGKLDILDVIIVNKAVLGKEKLEDSQIACIDFNGNGKPDAEDALVMMKKIVGLL